MLMLTWLTILSLIIYCYCIVHVNVDVVGYIITHYLLLLNNE
jgi:hypothetical protein